MHRMILVVFIILAATAAHFAQSTATDLFDLGNAKMDRQDCVGAIADYTGAIELDPQLAEAFNNRGGIRNKRDDPDCAFSDYTRAIELNSNYSLAYFNRGLVRIRKKDHDGAIADLSRSLELDPRQPRAYLNRGSARFLKEDQDGAIGPTPACISSGCAIGASKPLTNLTLRSQNSIGSYRQNRSNKRQCNSIEQEYSFCPFL